MLVALAVGQVLEGAGDERRRAVGEHLAQAHDTSAQRPVGGQRRARPRGSRGSRAGSASGSDVKLRLIPSIARWSPGQSAGSPYGHHEPASRPAVCTPEKREPAVGGRAPAPAGRRVQAQRAAADARRRARPARPPTARAARCSRPRAGIGSWIQARSIGSSMIPVSTPLQPVVEPAQRPPAGTRSSGRAGPPAARRAPTARSGPCAGRAGPRAAAGSRSCSRPPSRRPRRRRPRCAA